MLTQLFYEVKITTYLLVKMYKKNAKYVLSEPHTFTYSEIPRNYPFELKKSNWFQIQPFCNKIKKVCFFPTAYICSQFTCIDI